MNKKKIIIPGAAGLVGQNLIVLLKEKGYSNIVAIDKHDHNTGLLKKLHPEIVVINADVSKKGKWEDSFKDADVIVMLQAQIGAKTIEPFLKNNIVSTKRVLNSAGKHNVPYIVHVSSSVVLSAAEDFYTNTKKSQEELVKEYGINHCVLRPPLMFGWFDRKHLGWLSRFMTRIPVYPIPGDGKFMRQPLYVRDFCQVIIKSLEKQPANKIFNIIGRENIDYIDIIRTIKRIKKLNTLIIRIPYGFFHFLLRLYAVFDDDPPFTAEQLEALVAGDQFPVDNWWDEFDINPTPFGKAMEETHLNPEYGKYILEF